MERERKRKRKSKRRDYGNEIYDMILAFIVSGLLYTSSTRIWTDLGLASRIWEAKGQIPLPLCLKTKSYCLIV